MTVGADVLLATTVVREAHHVHLRHTVTGATVGPVTAAVDPPLPVGWWLRVRAGDVLVARRDGAADLPTTPDLTVVVTGPQALLVTPASVTVPLAASETVVDVDPVPMTLTLDLTTATGTPRTGRTVTARATSGPAPRPSVPLTEDAPGTYRTAPTTWTAAHAPLDLLVDGDLLRQVPLDLTRTDTRIRLVDTT